MVFKLVIAASRLVDIWLQSLFQIALQALGAMIGIEGLDIFLGSG
jgi:hypothetical protein